MALVRILNPKQFDREKHRFSNVAFKPSSGADPTSPDGKCGISVFHLECACGDGPPDCICEHIARFYSPPYSEPAVYWVFEEDILESPDPSTPEPVIVSVPSDSGDDCHRNIHHVTPKRSKTIFYRAADPPEDHLHICMDRHSEPWDEERLVELSPLLPGGV